MPEMNLNKKSLYLQNAVIQNIPFAYLLCQIEAKQHHNQAINKVSTRNFLDKKSESAVGFVRVLRDIDSDLKYPSHALGISQLPLSVGNCKDEVRGKALVIS